MSNDLRTHELSAEQLEAVVGGASMLQFQLQTLMSRYNQAETLASSVARRQQQTTSSIINNIK